MLSLFILVLSTFIFSIILIVIMMMVSKKSMDLREKWVPFECGFNLFNQSRSPFSMRFFLIAILFIIFDVEIAIILPLITAIYKIGLMKWFISSLVLIFLILLGTLMEWKESTFEWKF